MHAMTRSTILHAAAAFLLFICAGCDGSGGGDGNDQQPAGGASATPESTVFPESSDGIDQILSEISCDSDVLTVVTASRIFRADLPCDRFPPADVIARFQQEPTEVEVQPGNPGKVFLRATAAGSLEFTVQNVEVAER
jgi:hypothetical protein